MPIMVIPNLLSDNLIQFVRISGFIGLVILGLVWDSKVMSKFSDEKLKEYSENCYIKRKAEKNGFHREVRTSISIPEFMVHHNGETSSIRICILEHIPAGLYVDLYQVRANQEFGGPQVYSEVDIDTEKPEHLSTPHDVYVFSELKKNGPIFHAELTLPMHLRYHKPSTEALYTQIYLQPPSIFLNLSDESLQDTRTVEKFVCDSSATSQCSWQQIQCITIPEQGTLEFSVPVGQKADTEKVTIITILITVLSTLFLAQSILRKKINTKQEKIN